MLKFLTLFAVLFGVSIVYATPGGIKPINNVPEELETYVRNSMKTLASATRFAGTYSFIQIRNVRKQVVAGLRYYFTVDVLASPVRANDQKVTMTCEASVIFRPWDKDSPKKLVDEPVCRKV